MPADSPYVSASKLCVEVKGHTWATITASTLWLSTAILIASPCMTLTPLNPFFSISFLIPESYVRYQYMLFVILTWFIGKWWSWENVNLRYLCRDLNPGTYWRKTTRKSTYHCDFTISASALFFGDERSAARHIWRVKVLKMYLETPKTVRMGK